MRNDKQTAISLRLQGKSYSEIQKVLTGISKSTLSLWLNNLVISDQARKRLKDRERGISIVALIRRNKLQTAEAIKRSIAIRTKSKEEIEILTNSNLLLVGVALYWAEGHKMLMKKDGRELTSHAVSFTNSDPKLLSIFIKFLEKICEVPREKIKIGLRIFQHMNEKEAIGFWSKSLGIPGTNFYKTYIGVSRSSSGKRPFNRLPYGVVQIRINDTNLFHRIMGWIEGLKAQS